MCLLTFMQEGVTADIDLLTTGAQNNPDGFGFAVHAGNKIIHASGMNFDRVLDEFLKTRRVHSGPALFHSRITTHGSTSVDNCHPFQIGRDRDSVLAHNGILPIPSHGGRSDTRILAEDLIPSWGGVTAFDGKKFRKKISKFADGSKLVVITANKMTKDDFYIINEKDGHWVDGVWWSNNSYKYARYSYTGGTMYSTGWEPAYRGNTPTDLDTESDYVVCDNGDVVQWHRDEDGVEYPVEWWTCYTCGADTMIVDQNYDETLFCETCDSCWYCTEPRILCKCRHNDEWSYDDMPSVDYLK